MGKKFQLRMPAHTFALGPLSRRMDYEDLRAKLKWIAGYARSEGWGKAYVVIPRANVEEATGYIPNMHTDDTRYLSLPEELRQLLHLVPAETDEEEVLKAIFNRTCMFGRERVVLCPFVHLRCVQGLNFGTDAPPVPGPVAVAPEAAVALPGQPGHQVQQRANHRSVGTACWPLNGKGRRGGSSSWRIWASRRGWAQTRAPSWTTSRCAPA